MYVGTIWVPALAINNIHLLSNIKHTTKEVRVPAPHILQNHPTGTLENVVKLVGEGAKLHAALLTPNQLVSAIKVADFLDAPIALDIACAELASRMEHMTDTGLADIYVAFEEGTNNS